MIYESQTSLGRDILPAGDGYTTEEEDPDLDLNISIKMNLTVNFQADKRSFQLSTVIRTRFSHHQ